VRRRSHLAGHSIDTADERGWSNLSNGDLLDAAERDGYQLLITTDQNLRYQLNLVVVRFYFAFFSEEDETAYLLKSPANRARLLKTVENVAQDRNLVTVNLDELT